MSEDCRFIGQTYIDKNNDITARDRQETSHGTRILVSPKNA